jgi:hypothetical protein
MTDRRTFLGAAVAALASGNTGGAYPTEFAVAPDPANPCVAISAYLNGRRVRGCVTASAAEGWVDQWVVGPDGLHAHDASGRAIYQRTFGRVQLFRHDLAEQPKEFL